MKSLLILFLTTLAIGAEQKAPSIPPRQTVTFSEVKPACELIENKLVLAKVWPMGSWESCAYSVLQAASQLSLQNNACQAELQAIKAKRK